MKTILLRVVLYIFFTIGILGSWNLAWNEFIQSDICPQIMWIPACYIIFIFFIGLFILSFYEKLSIYYYVLATIPFWIALYWTVFQLIGWVNCPTTTGWTPMCYISLFLFSGLIITHYILKKYKNNH